MVAIPPTPDEPKVACNSGARTFYSTPKRCNSNDVMSNLEIHAGGIACDISEEPQHEAPQGPQAEDSSSPEDAHRQG